MFTPQTMWAERECQSHVGLTGLAGVPPHLSTLEKDENELQTEVKSKVPQVLPYGCASLVSMPSICKLHRGKFMEYAGKSTSVVAADHVFSRSGLSSLLVHQPAHHELGRVKVFADDVTDARSLGGGQAGPWPWHALGECDLA